MDSEDERVSSNAQRGQINSHSGNSSSQGDSSDLDSDDDNDTEAVTQNFAQQQPLPDTDEPSRAVSPSTVDPTASLSTYVASVSQRRSLFHPPPLLASTSASGAYSLESIFTIPHSTHIHAFAAPPCSSHLYTGGADGFIRRYSLFHTLNGTGVDNPLFNNLTIKPGGHAPAATADVRQAVLVGYWENEEPGAWTDELLGGKSVASGGELASTIKWGPKGGAIAGQSVVYSLAVQSEELWGLSGTGQGTINLFTIRHDEGQIRHVFRSSELSPAIGHHPKAPVSVLTLADDESSLLSGGWDSRLLQWDLNTGTSVRDYTAHTGQISTIAFRPTSRLPPDAPPPLDDDTEMDDVEQSGRRRLDEAGESTAAAAASKSNGDLSMASPVSSSSSSTSVAAALVLPTTAPSSFPIPLVPEVAPNVVLDDGQGSEADADGEDEDAMMAFPPPTTSTGTPTPINRTDASALSTANGVIGAASMPILPLPAKNVAIKSVPVVGGSDARGLPELSSDVFMSTSIDGQVMIWDRRIKSGKKGGVRRLDSSGKHGSWCASASWSPSGQQIYVGRRSSIVEIYDIRHSSPSSPVLQTLRLPSSSGPVSALASLPSGNHLVTASTDNIRLWDLDLAARAPGNKVPFKIVPGHHGGMTSQLYVDPLAKFMVSVSGNRGWEGTSTENLIVHQIKPTF